MSNKISTVVDNLVAGLRSLVVAGTIKSLAEEIINAQVSHNVPRMGLAISRFWRTADDAWHAELLLQLVARKGAGSSHTAVLDLVAAVDANIKATVLAGNVGGNVDRPVWDTWHNAAPGGDLLMVGAMGTLDIDIAGPLLTE